MLNYKSSFFLKLVLGLSATMLLISQGALIKLWANKSSDYIVLYKQSEVLNVHNVLFTPGINTSVAIRNRSHHIYQFYRRSLYNVNRGRKTTTIFYVPPDGTVLLPGQQFIVGVQNKIDSSTDAQFLLRDLSSSRNIHLSVRYQYVGRAFQEPRAGLKLSFEHSTARYLAPNGTARFDYLPRVETFDDTLDGSAAPGSDATYFDAQFFLFSNYYGSNSHINILDQSPDESNGVATQQPPVLSAPHRFYYCVKSDCHLAYRLNIVSGSLNANVNYHYDRFDGLNIHHYNISMLPYLAHLTDESGKRQDLVVPLAPGLMFERANHNVSLSTTSEFVVPSNGNGVQDDSLINNAYLSVSQQLDALHADDEVLTYKYKNDNTGVVKTSDIVLLSSATDTPVNEDVSNLYTLLTSNTDKLYGNGEQEAKLGVLLCRVAPAGGKCADPVPQDSPLYNDIYFTYSSDNDSSTRLVTNAYKSGGTITPVLIESVKSDDGIGKHYTTEYPGVSTIHASVNPTAKQYYFSALSSKSTSAIGYVLHANLCEPDNTGKVRCADNNSKVVMTAFPQASSKFRAIPSVGDDKKKGILFTQPLTCLTTVTHLTTKADYLPTFRDSELDSTPGGAIRGVINYFDPTARNGTFTCDSSNDKYLVALNSKINNICHGDIRAVDKAGNYYHGLLYPQSK